MLTTQSIDLESMAFIDELKEALEIEPLDTSKDSMIDRYISQARVKIMNYEQLKELNEVDKIVGINDAIFDYVITLFNIRGYEGFKQYSEGGMHLTLLDNDGLPQSTKALLPKPIPKVCMR